MLTTLSTIPGILPFLSSSCNPKAIPAEQSTNAQAPELDSFSEVLDRRGPDAAGRAEVHNLA